MYYVKRKVGWPRAAACSPVGPACIHDAQSSGREADSARTPGAASGSSDIRGVPSNLASTVDVINVFGECGPIGLRRGGSVGVAGAELSQLRTGFRSPLPARHTVRDGFTVLAHRPITEQYPDSAPTRARPAAGSRARDREHLVACASFEPAHRTSRCRGGSDSTLPTKFL